MSKQTRQHYDKALKETVVSLIYSGQKVKKVSEDFNLRPELIRRWRRELAKDGEFGKRKELSEEEKEIRRLKRELKYITEERDILKKAISIFSKKDR